MSVAQTYKEIVTDLKETFFGSDEIDGFRIERDEYYAPDLVYTLDNPDTWSARAQYIPAIDRPVQITYSLSNIYQTHDSASGDEVRDFLTYYEIVELEEITHCMGEVDVEPDHSMQWIDFLAENVVSYTSDADYVEIRFE